MDVLIQQISSGFFLKDDHGWTERKEHAQRFLKCIHAIDHCICHDLKDVRLVYAFKEPNLKSIVFPPLRLTRRRKRRRPAVRSSQVVWESGGAEFTEGA